MSKSGDGTDDLYIKIDGNKMWPAGEKYRKISWKESLSPDLVISVPETQNHVCITLMEYDWGSGDDLLGELQLPIGEVPIGETMRKEYTVLNSDEGSCYTIDLEVRPHS